MPLFQLSELEYTTRNNISKEQMRRDSGEISEQEYEERYEAIMQNYRLKTEQLLHA
jgi:hypothetical protein